MADERGNSKTMKRVIFGQIGLIALLIGALFGVAYGANEASKDFRPQGPAGDGDKAVALEASPGVAVATDGVKSFSSILEMPLMEVQTIREMRDVVLELAHYVTSKVSLNIWSQCVFLQSHCSGFLPLGTPLI